MNEGLMVVDLIERVPDAEVAIVSARVTERLAALQIDIAPERVRKLLEGRDGAITRALPPEKADWIADVFSQVGVRVRVRPARPDDAPAGEPAPSHVASPPAPTPPTAVAPTPAPVAETPLPEPAPHPVAPATTDPTPAAEGVVDEPSAAAISEAATPPPTPRGPDASDEAFTDGDRDEGAAHEGDDGATPVGEGGDEDPGPPEPSEDLGVDSSEDTVAQPASARPLVGRGWDPEPPSAWTTWRSGAAERVVSERAAPQAAAAVAPTGRPTAPRPTTPSPSRPAVDVDEAVDAGTDALVGDAGTDADAGVQVRRVAMRRRAEAAREPRRSVTPRAAATAVGSRPRPDARLTRRRMLLIALAVLTAVFVALQWWMRSRAL